MSLKSSPIPRATRSSISSSSACSSTINNKRIAATLLAQKGIQQGIDRCDRALEIAATDAPTFNYRGRANYLLNNYDQAIDDFTRAISLDPKQAIYHSNRGYSFIGARQY